MMGIEMGVRNRERYAKVHREIKKRKKGTRWDGDAERRLSDQSVDASKNKIEQ